KASPEARSRKPGNAEGPSVVHGRTSVSPGTVWSPGGGRLRPASRPPPPPPSLPAEVRDLLARRSGDRYPEGPPRRTSPGRPGWGARMPPGIGLGKETDEVLAGR